jgi:hypothetical protein
MPTSFFKILKANNWTVTNISRRKVSTLKATGVKILTYLKYRFWYWEQLLMRHKSKYSSNKLKIFNYINSLSNIYVL